MKNLLALLPLTALLAACDSQPLPPPPQAEVGPLPADFCNKVQEGLVALKDRGALVYNDKGEATIEQQVWLQMGSGPQEDLVNALGFHAACVSGGGSGEQNVVVRDEGGRALTQRIVATKGDVGELLGKDQP